MENPFEKPAGIDPLGHIDGPFSHMRKVLFSVHESCLPHSHLGFWDSNAEARARKIVEEIEAGKRIVGILTKENPLEWELREAA